MTPWSITTTMRNPYRLRDLLAVLKTMEGTDWSRESQSEYQIRLIQNRLYGYKSRQFYNGLSPDQEALVDDATREITSDTARQIFLAKNYEDPPMRGRQSVNPLKKFGFAVAEKGREIEITELGELFLHDEYDLQEIFLSALLKWQIPNPENKRTFNSTDYDVKPFLGVLHLIDQVNHLEEHEGRPSKGISRTEFALFAPTLVHHREIEDRAHQVVDLRKKLSDLPVQERQRCFDSYALSYVDEFNNGTSRASERTLLNNLYDYGDNAIRYFRLTSYIHIRGNGFYIDLEPRRSVELEALLESDDGRARAFADNKEFLAYISDPSVPRLPWDTPDHHEQIILKLVNGIQELESVLDEPFTHTLDYSSMDSGERKKYIATLRKRRLSLQDALKFKKSQEVGEIRSCIEVLDSIYEHEQRPILLEKMSAFGMYAMNDAIRIQPNYPVGDDNEPTFTAPSNTPDIECFYESFNAICEVTMLRNRDQWYNEGQPVMRHLRDFEDCHVDKPAYCLFVAPIVHRDTMNTFWSSVKHGYEGRPQRIIPLSIEQFSRILGTLCELRLSDAMLTHAQLRGLFDEILTMSNSTSDSKEWMSGIPQVIDSWAKQVLE